MFEAEQRIGPYTLLRKLGSGGYGEVWLGRRHDAMAAPEVALKMPRDDQSDLNEIRAEARMWVNASGHPNVLPFIEANVYDGQVVLVSEYVAGGTLTKWLVKNGGRAPSLASTLEMTTGILAGLHHLHTRTPPIVHCDLKPDNIMLQGDVPRLTDFGISRADKIAAYNRQFTGTLAYMSPEAFKGESPPQRDLWAAGVLLYLLLTGRLPFPQEDARQAMAAIFLEEPPALPNTIPASIRRIVRKALHKDPAKRFNSAEQMRTALLQANFAQHAGFSTPTKRVGSSVPPALTEQPTVAFDAAVPQAYERAEASSSAPVSSSRKTMDYRVFLGSPRPMKIILSSAPRSGSDAEVRRLWVIAALAAIMTLTALGLTLSWTQPKPASRITGASAVVNLGGKTNSDPADIISRDRPVSTLGTGANNTPEPGVDDGTVSSGGSGDDPVDQSPQRTR